MNLNKIIDISTYAGKILLENGSETYRVEETITKICKEYNVKDVCCLATPTGITTTIKDIYGNHITNVQRVSSRGINLDKINEINNLSRNIVEFGLSVDEFKDRLIRIDKRKKYNNLMNYVFSGICSSSFTVIFNGNYKDFLCAFIIGFLLRIILMKINQFNINSFFINILGGMFISSIAVFFDNFHICSNLNTVIIGSIMLLVPGIAITNAIRDTISGDLISGSARAIEAFLIAIGIAIGNGVILNIYFKL